MEDRSAEGCRDWSRTFTVKDHQGQLMAPRARKGHELSQEPPEGTSPTNTPISNFFLPKLRKALSISSHMCHGSTGNLTHHPPWARVDRPGGSGLSTRGPCPVLAPSLREPSCPSF